MCVYITGAFRVEPNQLRSKAFSWPQHRAADTPVILDSLQSSGDSNKAIPLTQFTSTTIADDFQPTFFLVLHNIALKLSKENAPFFHQAYEYLDPEKQNSFVVILTLMQVHWGGSEIMMVKSLFGYWPLYPQWEPGGFQLRSTIFYIHDWYCLISVSWQWRV